MNLPNKFEFFNSVGTKCYAERLPNGEFHIAWIGKTYNGTNTEFEMNFSEISVIDHFDRSLWKMLTQTTAEDKSLLPRIKQFTIDTGISIFISDGEYEVYCNGFDDPAKASSDEELEKIMDAIITLENATYGEDNA